MGFARPGSAWKSTPPTASSPRPAGPGGPVISIDLPARGDVADGQVLDQVRAGPRPGQGGEGERHQRAVGGDQDGAGAVQVGAERVPDATAQRGGRRLKGFRPARNHRAAPAPYGVGHRQGWPEGDQRHGPAGTQDEGQQSPLAPERALALLGAGPSGCTRTGR